MPESPLSSSTRSGRHAAVGAALDYAHPAQRVPLGQKTVDVLKTLAWVAPLTILIWIYAEREQSIPVSGVSFPIEVRTTDPTRLVTLRDPADHNVVATLLGPRTSVERVMRELQAGGAEHPAVQITIENFKERKGEYRRQMADVLSRNPIF